MKHAEKVAPVAAAVTSLATLACCLPMGFAAAAAMASASAVVAAYQRWFLGASIVLLVVGLVQLRTLQRTCARRRPASSLIVFGVSALIVLLVVLFPQAVAGIVADWLP